MPQKITTTDDALQFYQDRDLSSAVIARVPTGLDIQVGAATVREGREWLEATLEDGKAGYILGPSARSHTTLMPAPALKLSAMDQGAMEGFLNKRASPLRKAGWLLLLAGILVLVWWVLYRLIGEMHL
jgi:hypothetical protein